MVASLRWCRTTVVSSLSAAVVGVAGPCSGGAGWGTRSGPGGTPSGRSAPATAAASTRAVRVAAGAVAWPRGRPIDLVRCWIRKVSTRLSKVSRDETMWAGVVDISFLFFLNFSIFIYSVLFFVVAYDIFRGAVGSEIEFLAATFTLVNKFMPNGRLNLRSPFRYILFENSARQSTNRPKDKLTNKHSDVEQQ